MSNASEELLYWMNINFHQEKHNQHFSVTAFPKIVGIFLQEDILQYKDNFDNLTDKSKM